MSTVNRQIMVAAGVVAACTLAAKVVAALKDLVLAHEYGIGQALDAFLLAYVFPAFVINILAGSVQAAFIPKYLSAWRERGEAFARHFAASTAASLFVALLIGVLIVAPLSVTALPLIGANLPVEALQITKSLALILSPVIVLNGLMYFWAGVLNSHDRFAFAAIIPVLTPIFIACSAMLFSGSAGPHALVAGALVGGLAELAVIAVAVRRIGQTQLFARPTSSPARRAMIGQFSAAAVGNVLLGATLVVDQSFAASLGTGSVSTLSFGTKVTQVVAGMFTMAVGTAVLPNVARLVANRDWSAIRGTLRKYLGLILLCTVPLTLLLVFFSSDICQLLFERGKFDAQDTAIVSRVQMLYALQIPFFSAGVLAVRLLSALSANQVLVLGAAISLGLDITLNALLAPRLGVAGIGLATSLLYLVSCIYLLTAVHRRLTALERQDTL